MLDMANLTKIEQHAYEALDNESMECTPKERAAFVHQIRAYRNAASYADQWGHDVDDFRATLTKITGVNRAEAFPKGLAQ